MSIIRTIVGAILGAVVATTLAWAGLYAYGALILHAQGSLFDTNPSAANQFFVGWIGATVFATVVGAGLGLRSGTNE